MSNAVEIAGLVKTFGQTRALDGLDLTIATGEVRGFLGPNGSGKTTTIRVLLGLLRADSGSVELLGGDPYSDAVELHRRIAYVPGDVELWPNLTGGQAIAMLSRLRGDADPARVDALCHDFDLDPTKKARTYSKGNRQKVALVAALSSNADLFILDEPTSGLDPLMEAVFRREVARIKERGATILLSSHILSEVEALADTITIIRDGSVVESGTLSQMRHLQRTTIRATTREPVAGLDVEPGVHDLTIDGATVTAEVDSEQVGAVMARLAQAGIESIEAQPPTLEQMLLRYYGGAADR